MLNNELQSDKNFRGIKIPELPPKSISFTDASKKELSSQRIPKLEEYLTGLVSRTVFLSSPKVRHFLEMPNSVQELAVLLSQRQSTSIKQGYMEKKGQFHKTWKKRWFVLQPNYVLKYYKQHTSTDPQGSVDVSTVTNISSKMQSDEKPFSFSLKAKDRTWWLACEDEQTKKDWVKVFMRLKDIKAPPKHARVDTRKLSLNLGPHFKTITQIAWNPILPGVIATGSEDETCKIWTTHLLDQSLAPDTNENEKAESEDGDDNVSELFEEASNPKQEDGNQEAETETEKEKEKDMEENQEQDKEKDKVEVVYWENIFIFFFNT